ncbi:uncharacterized protein C6orf118-like [Solea solea]|uniref:uncharacterized protein C6orf118-like n=1 Tax=Solea solea TaxID=90069 RepID=UPI00272ADB5F|nr:uncharacterized protein C6orf118-like [Solea solea]
MSSSRRPNCFRSDVHRLLQAAEAGQRADVLTYFSGHLGPRSLNHSLPRMDTKQRFWKMSKSREETPDPLTLSAPSQKKQHFSSNPEGKQQGLNNEDQLKTKQWFGRESAAKQDPWVGINVAEMHERKLHKELKKLSAQSWPSRDRLAVFSDVFDDVCEYSPVFGRILREIKTDYDLYVNHLMASQSPPHDMLLNASLCKVKEMEIEDAEKEICRLELEARRALKENKRVRMELQKGPAIMGPLESSMKNISLSGLQDSGTSVRHTNKVQLKRLQVLNMWREIQQLEEEIKEKLVSTDTTAATEKDIEDLKAETIRLIASNDRLKTTNQWLTCFLRNVFL